jgi:hypothetical protein
MIGGLVLLSAGAGVGALSAASAALGPDKSGFVGNIQLQVGPTTPPVPFVTDSAVIGLPGGRQVQLHAQASGGLTGWTSPVGVSSQDGRYIVYDAWTDETTLDPERSFSQQGIVQGQPLGRPSLHLLDTATGSDTLFQDGAYSFAWRTDGAVAYFKSQDPDFRANQPYVGEVMVQSSLQADPVSWTSDPDRYIVIAWAGQTLLAYRVGEGEVLDLVSFSAPGKEQLLSSSSVLVAVSPDGSQVLVSQGTAGSGTARLVEVVGGGETARLDLSQAIDPATGQPLRYLSYGGSWVDNRIAAEGGSGIVIFNVDSSELRVEKVLSFPSTQFPMPIHEPQFTDETASRVVAWAPIPGKGGLDPDRLYMYLDCALASRACVHGPPRGDRSFYHIYNPSRPL